jgi:N-methylhydantoinase A/oxoprolinase/acetone carboxylase beta subunit
MYAGLDVGGTHTDAVLLDARTGACLDADKAPTRPDDVLPGVLEALAALFGDSARQPAQSSGGLPPPAAVRRLTVSTTLGLNSLLTGRTDPVGMIVLPGPGLDPRLFWGDDPLFHVLPGAQDHRGRIVEEPPAGAVAAAFAAIRRLKARAVGIVCKFSPKNPALEQALAALARQEFGPDMPLVLGAETSGSLDFPRRMHTVWCNAALAAVNARFLRSLGEALARMGFTCPLSVLKADAASFPAAEAARDPASCMGSGPAASLLGVWALSSGSLAQAADADLVMIDMGGTSTDLAFLAKGHPLLAGKGLTVAGRPTLIRTLWTRSLALGGDSALRLVDGEPRVGPDRSGPALALQPDAASTRPPTQTDALNVLGLTRLGDVRISRAALAKLAAAPDCPPAFPPAFPKEAKDNPEALAELFVRTALSRVAGAVRALLAEVNSRPVYTIRELLLTQALAPAYAVFIGGPAKALAGMAENALRLPVLAPEESAWANALGAALALPGKSAELYADTLLGRMSVPDFSLEKNIDRGYSLDEAKKDLLAAFAAGADDASPAAQIRYAESFAMIDDRGRRGRTIRVSAQRAAGLAVLEG